MQKTISLISARWIAPVEPADTLFENHTVVIEGGTIKAIMPTAAARASYVGAVETKLENHILIPGLINLHTHAAMTLLRGLADDKPLMTWLNDHIWPAETKLLSKEFVLDGTQLACAESLRAGVTCFADMYFYHDTAAAAVRKAGMRAALGGAILEFPTPYASDAEAYIQRALEVRQDFDSDPTLKLLLSPHAPYTVSDATFERVATIAAEMDVQVMVHIQETASEITDSLKQYNERPIARLDRLGVIGPNLIAVHCVHMNAEEIALFSAKSVHVAHCPVSNLKLGSGIAPINAMLAANINVGIGTDGTASNNRLDMLAEARLAGLLQKGVSGDAASLPALKLLEMCTLAPAKALGWDAEIGSLLPGKACDMVALNLDTIETQPVFDPLSHLFYAAGREHVSHVWVDGKVLLENGKLTRLDEAELMIKAKSWAARVGS
jgi:5-methylthioadenosine/S-adenosylhomocysteine deaminase